MRRNYLCVHMMEEGLRSTGGQRVHVVVVGGGWAGCAAAWAARQAGAEVTLVEKTDMLLGTGLVGDVPGPQQEQHDWITVLVRVPVGPPY